MKGHLKWLVVVPALVALTLAVVACSAGGRVDGDIQLEGRTGSGQPVTLEPRDPRRSE